MSIRIAVFVHEPLTDSGWNEVDRDLSPDEAANVTRAWGAKGWRVMTVSMECLEQGWNMEFPHLALA